MSDCVFCDIVAGRLPARVVHDDPAVLAFLDLRPFTPGHTLVIPKCHAPFLADLDEGTASQLFAVTRRVAAALRRYEVRCEGVNLFLSDGEAAGQEIFHLHMHVFPRFAGDSLGPGRPFARSPAEVSRRELDAIAAQLRRAYRSGEAPPPERS
jgi:histidine triad (HIT) family protein